MNTTTRRWRGAIAGLIGLMLVATAAVSVGVVLSSGILAAPAQELTGPLAASGPVSEPLLEADDGITVTAGFQVTQPRDPFRPLITPDSPAGGQPGVGGDPGSGDYTPDITTIKLNEIRDVGGVLRASVTVNGITYDVGVGDTFADSFKVISLTEDEMVYSFGDAVRTLTVGQQILK